jgi:RHS repeat-associated protein
LLSATGVRAADYSYNAWGGLTASAGTLANDRQYTGHYRDAETGLHYLGARYYDDEQARFLAQDPRLGDSGSPNSLHRFLYANANPLRYVDPTGYTSEPVGASGDDPKKEATGTKKGKSNQAVDPERRNTVIDSQTGEHYVPWWSDRQVVAEARKEAKEAAAREIRALEQSLDRADKYNEDYLEWSLAKGQAEAREKMAKVRQLEALVSRGGSGDKLQYFTDQWAHMVATAGDDPGLVQAGAAGLIQAIGQYMGGALNVGSGLGTLSGKLDVEETTGVAPSGWDYLAAGADVMQVGGTVGGALANVSRASRVREARTAIQSAFDQEQVGRALMAPAGLVDDASRLGAVTELADTWIGRTLRSDEILTEVVPRVRFDGPILNHLVDAPTQVMSRAELVAASVARDVAKVVDIPETFMGAVRSRLLDIGVGVVSRQEAMRLGKPLTWDNPARLIYDKIILVEDALVNAAQRRDLAGAISGNKFGIFEATDVLRANLLHEIGERAIRLFQKGGMSRPVLFNLEVEDVILRRLATEDPEMARRLSQLIGTGAFK